MLVLALQDRNAYKLPVLRQNPIRTATTATI